MTIFTGLPLAARTISRTRFRTFLMMLGIVVGISSLTVLNSIGEGTKQETMKRVKNMLGTFDTVLIRPGAGKMRGMVSVTNAPPNIKFEDADAIARDIPEVRQVATLQNAFDVDVKYRDRSATPAVFGVSENWLDLRGDELAQGDFISQADVRSVSRVAVLGLNAQKDLFGDEDPLKKTLVIGNVPFQVNGLMAPRGAGPAGGSLDNLILIPVTTASKRLFNRDFLTMVVAQLRNPRDSATAVRKITELLRERHHLAPTAIADFTITDPQAVMKQLTSVGNTLTRTLFGVSVAAVVLGGIVIMSLMLIGVSERRREIGIRRSVGASRFDVVLQLLLESSLVAFAGGLIGVAIGIAAVKGVAQLARLPFVLSPADFALAALLSVAVGVVFGVYPAIRAARTDPIKALRA